MSTISVWLVNFYFTAATNEKSNCHHSFNWNRKIVFNNRLGFKADFVKPTERQTVLFDWIQKFFFCEISEIEIRVLRYSKQHKIVKRMQLQHCTSNTQLQRHTAPLHWQNAQLTIPNKFNRCQAFTYLLHNVTAFRCAKWHSKYVSRWFYYTCLSRKPIQSIETYTVIKLFWNTANISLLRNLYMLAKECEFIYHKKSLIQYLPQ